MDKKRALISVWDKSNIVEFAKELIKLDYEIISTGGTFEILKKNNINVIKIDKVINFPEILNGRVKTLNPRIHGGILASRDNEEHLSEIKKHDIHLIDIVVVNLYPFIDVINKKGTSHKTAIENIDIGGPTMLRSAAKNYKFITVINDIKDYDLVIKELKEHKNTLLKTREYLASKVFQETSYYDAHIANYMNSVTGNTTPEKLTLPFKISNSLRYGENPHQKASFYVNNDSIISIANSIQLQGKQLSYNNIRDANTAIQILMEFKKPTVVGLKHMNPCGVGSADNIDDAWSKSFEGDSVSIFGGVVATNQIINKNVAEKMNEIFLEIILAPNFSEEALEIFKKKKNLRLLKIDLNRESDSKWEYTSVNGGILKQEIDSKNINDCTKECVTIKQPNSREQKDIDFAQKIVKHVKSNAIVIVKNEQLIGVGAGQMNRVSAAKIALEWAKDKTKNAVMASDAFFPFNDVVELANKFNISSIVQPGGSIKDKDSIELADKYNISMVFTNMRHFKH